MYYFPLRHNRRAQASFVILHIVICICLNTLVFESTTSDAFSALLLLEKELNKVASPSRIFLPSRWEVLQSTLTATAAFSPYNASLIAFVKDQKVVLQNLDTDYTVNEAKVPAAASAFKSLQWQPDTSGSNSFIIYTYYAIFNYTVGGDSAEQQIAQYFKKEFLGLLDHFKEQFPTACDLLTKLDATGDVAKYFSMKQNMLVFDKAPDSSWDQQTLMLFYWTVSTAHKNVRRKQIKIDISPEHEISAINYIADPISHTVAIKAAKQALSRLSPVPVKTFAEVESLFATITPALYKEPPPLWWSMQSSKLTLYDASYSAPMLEISDKSSRGRFLADSTLLIWNASQEELYLLRRTDNSIDKGYQETLRSQKTLHALFKAETGMDRCFIRCINWAISGDKKICTLLVALYLSQAASSPVGMYIISCNLENQETQLIRLDTPSEGISSGIMTLKVPTKITFDTEGNCQMNMRYSSHHMGDVSLEPHILLNANGSIIALYINNYLYTMHMRFF